MNFKSESENDSLDFEWLDKVEVTNPYIDNLVRNPKLALITESDIVKIEKAKKVSIDTIKNLSKHTEYIDKLDPVTDEVQPSKLLITRGEETYNTYENRFIFTLIHKLDKFVDDKKKELEEIKEKKNKVLNYISTTNNGSEKITMEMKVSTQKLYSDEEKNNFEKELDQIRERILRVSQYLSGWRKSEFYKSLEKARAIFVKNPVKKTNLILKNPNFQMAMKLWDFLRQFDDDSEANQEGLESNGDDNLKGLLDDSFLTSYFVLDSISDKKRDQKEKLSKYARIMIDNQIKKVVELLLNSGIEITEEEILGLIADQIKEEKNKRLAGTKDVKNKFKSAIEEYLEKTKDYL